MRKNAHTPSIHWIIIAWTNRKMQYQIDEYKTKKTGIEIS